MSEEISLSVDDTNALRARLGLKPLKISEELSEANEAVLNDDKDSKLADTRADSEVKEGKRLLEEISSGGGILDCLNVSDLLNGASSPQEKKTKLLSSSKSSNSDSSSASESDDYVAMSRIKISHDLKDISEKGERILVMQDKSVLDESDSEDHAVAMEDIDLAREERDKTNERRAKHGKKFNPYDDDWNLQEESILSKYDNIEEKERLIRQANTREFNIGSSILNESRPSGFKSFQYDASEEMPSSVRIGGSTTATQHKYFNASSSSGENLSFQSDFYTKQEVASFRKVKKDKKNKRKVVDEEDENAPVDVEKIQIERTAEEDEELYAQLSRLRRIQTTKMIDLPNEDDLAKSVIENRDEILEISTDPLPSAGISSFLSRVQTAMLAAQEESDERVIITSEEPQSFSEEESEVQVTESATTDEPPKPVIEDIKVDSGLACALKFFHTRGDIEKPPEKDVRLEHRDEFGRVLSAKEAYKQLSWKFHGVKPSAAKQEKRLRKIDNEIKARVGETSSSVSMKLMNEVQKEGKSHLVIPLK